MAASPQFKVYTSDREYIASVKYPDDAAVIIDKHGDGTTLRNGHTTVVWCEGTEIIQAMESYDIFTSIVLARTDGIVALGASRIE